MSALEQVEHVEAVGAGITRTSRQVAGRAPTISSRVGRATSERPCPRRLQAVRGGAMQRLRVSISSSVKPRRPRAARRRPTWRTERRRAAPARRILRAASLLVVSAGAGRRPRRHPSSAARVGSLARAAGALLALRLLAAAGDLAAGPRVGACRCGALASCAPPPGGRPPRSARCRRRVVQVDGASTLPRRVEDVVTGPSSTSPSCDRSAGRCARPGPRPRRRPGCARDRPARSQFLTVTRSSPMWPAILHALEGGPASCPSRPSPTARQSV